MAERKIEPKEIEVTLQKKFNELFAASNHGDNLDVLSEQGFYHIENRFLSILPGEFVYIADSNTGKGFVEMIKNKELPEMLNKIIFTDNLPDEDIVSELAFRLTEICVHGGLERLIIKISEMGCDLGGLKEYRFKDPRTPKDKIVQTVKGALWD